MQVKFKLWMIAVLWPSFVLAAVATGLFFSAFDPQQLMPFDKPTSLSRLAAYSAGFFAFWLFSAVSIAVGLFFMQQNSESETELRSGRHNRG